MIDNETIKDFLSRDLDALSNPEFGSQNFNEVKQNFGELQQLIREMIELGSVVALPSGLLGQVISFASVWKSHHENIRQYNLASDGQSGFRRRQTLISDIANWYQYCFGGYDSQNNRPNNFLTIYSAVKAFANKDIGEERVKIGQILKDFQDKKKDVDLITSELRKKSGEQTISDYAEIFKSEADKHSSFRIRPNFKVGSAERWLLIGVVMVIIFALTVTRINEWLGINFVDGQPGILVIQIITRLLIISIWVYIISFSFKQFSINKHLSTINRHRQNTLNSYKLFIQSLDPNDGLTKNALMMEVAKSIYEQGNTGHLSGKNAESSPSIIELTRFINQTGK